MYSSIITAKNLKSNALTSTTPRKPLRHKPQIR